MGYRAARNLNITGSLFSILTGISAVVSSIVEITLLLTQVHFVVSLTIACFAIYMILNGIRKLYEFIGIKDAFEILNTNIIVEPLDSDGKVVRITRERYIKLYQDQVASFYEGHLMSDGEINNVQAAIHLVDSPDPSSQERNSAPLAITGLDTIHKKDRNIYEFEFIPPEPLSKRSGIVKKNIYKQVVSWEAINGFLEEEEFYIMSIGQLTREVNLEIKCNADRPFLPNSGRIVKVQSEGLKGKISLDRTKYLNQTTNSIHCKITEPPKGDGYKVYWRWQKLLNAAAL